MLPLIHFFGYGPAILRLPINNVASFNTNDGIVIVYALYALIAFTSTRIMIMRQLLKVYLSFNQT